MFIESQSICVPLSVWVSPKLRGLTLQLGLYLFIIIIIINNNNNNNNNNNEFLYRIEKPISV